MSDKRLRDFERAYEGSATVENEAALLRERLRTGLLTADGVAMAALVGDPAARMALGNAAPEALPVPENNHQFIVWENKLFVHMTFHDVFMLALSALREGMNLLDTSEMSDFIRDYLQFFERYLQRDSERQKRELPVLNMWINEIQSSVYFDRGTEDSWFRCLREALSDLMIIVHFSLSSSAIMDQDLGLRLRLNSMYSTIVRAFQDPELLHPLTEQEAVHRVYQRCREDLLDRCLARREEELLDQGEETREFDLSQIREQIRQTTDPSDDSEDQPQ